MPSAAIEEGMRWEPPITSLIRRANCDTEVGGAPIPKGASLNISVASANRDPNRFVDPEVFNPHRADLSHMTFGRGPHTCLGMHVARMESAVAIGMLLDRIPDLRLDPNAVAPKITGVAFRSPAALSVVFSRR